MASDPFFDPSPPPGPICFSDEFAYPDGNLNGNGGWYGSATSQIQVLDGTVKIDGGAAVYDAIKTLVCSDPGTGEIKVTVKVHAGIGGETMWGLWYDDSGANNLARWYGKGTTARGRIGGTDAVTPEQPLTGGWDRLVVKIDPAANTSQFLFNGISIGTLDHSGTHAGDTLGRIRFERIDNGNAAGHYLYFDDLMVGQRPIPGDFDDDEDVDQADFGHLQACMAGTGLRYDNGCEDADMDSDGDVDETDFGSFQRCLSGANVPADPDCAS